jgi:hypothetical protein
MIYQCYYKQDQDRDLFEQDPYLGFGLEPEVNSTLFDNCPELEDPFVRMQLTEYACFLWHWRNGTDSWFGTTSYRQLEKFPTIFKDKKYVESLVEKHNVVAWGQYELFDKKGINISLSTQTKACHPGLNEYMEFVLSNFGHTMPNEWSTECSGFFANYWVMSRSMFDDFMEFSWPMVKYSLENIKSSDYYKEGTRYGTVSNEKATGYFMERLFLIWYLKKGITPFTPEGSASPLYHNI